MMEDLSILSTTEYVLAKQLNSTAVDICQYLSAEPDGILMP
jgi:hypothetical protein